LSAHRPHRSGLTVDDVERTIAFYVDVLGMTEVTFGSGRKALTFGSSKINLHQRGREFEPKAASPTPGSADLCLIAEDPMEVVVADLAASGVDLEEGPVSRTGARAPSQACTSATRIGISSSCRTTWRTDGQPCRGGEAPLPTP
jgi:catechol 2,3-dioxygenase-like lactoylglutathione lyase family enzyme